MNDRIEMRDCRKCGPQKMRYAPSDDMWVCGKCEYWWFPNEVKAEPLSIQEEVSLRHCIKCGPQKMHYVIENDMWICERCNLLWYEKEVPLIKSWEGP